MLATPPTSAPAQGLVPSKLLRRFDLVVFDWDGTAVANRSEDASEVCRLIEALLQRGVLVAVVTGTHLGNLERQLLAYIDEDARWNLLVSTNRGSEGWTFENPGGPKAIMRRIATEDEERALSEAALAVQKRLRERFGLETEIVFDRLNRRKIDLVPEIEDPPKSEIGSLVATVEAKLRDRGIEGGLAEVVELSKAAAAEQDLRDARVTTDAKHVEIGLTDKSDAVRWILREAASRRPFADDRVLVVGDELGLLGGVPGSDSLMMVPEAEGATFVSVGPEPGGLPKTVLHLGGGPQAFRALLARQVELHDRRKETEARKPSSSLPLRLTSDPAFRIVERGFELAREHEIESLLAIGNGHLGLRASLFEGSSLSFPALFVAGLFARTSSDGMPVLARAPDALRGRIRVDGHELSIEQCGGRNVRVLDLCQGALFRQYRAVTEQGRATHTSELRLACLAERDLVLQSLALVPENFSGILELELFTELLEAPGGITPQLSIVRIEAAKPNELLMELAGNGPSFPLVLGIRTFVSYEGGSGVPREIDRTAKGVVERFTLPFSMARSVRVDRILCVKTKREAEQPFEAATRRIRSLSPSSAQMLAERHRRAWNERWTMSDIELEGDEELTRALRFAAYHLVSAADPDDSRVSIGARGLTGTAYAGHVFWDTEIFMLPFFTLTYPEAARALLGYRHATLPAARKRAEEFGYRGALFAWESAFTGEDVTPRFSVLPNGEVVRVHTGELQHHISADVAFAAFSYWQISGDDAFLFDQGAELLIETARFWASRGRFEDDGLFHIRNVIGPDEYHVGVDDNAYTNGIARWNLERAASVVEWLKDSGERGIRKLEALAVGHDEPERWRKLARAIYFPLDPDSLLIEQFQGYFSLEDIDLRGHDPRLPIDVVLGSERVAGSQLIKQADVLMLLHLLADEFPRKVVEANFRYYEPRTAHGSSLSPGIHAAIAARLGLLETAERFYRETAAIDLGNRMGNAALGVHMATQGSLYQATLFGFAGLTLSAEAIELDPQLPAFAEALRFSLAWQGATLRIRIVRQPSSVEIELVSPGKRPVAVRMRQGPTAILEVGRPLLFSRTKEGWISLPRP